MLVNVQSNLTYYFEFFRLHEWFHASAQVLRALSWQMLRYRLKLNDFKNLIWLGLLLAIDDDKFSDSPLGSPAEGSLASLLIQIEIIVTIY